MINYMKKKKEILKKRKIETSP